MFLEHCAAEGAGLPMVQKMADPTVWPPLAAGRHTATDPMATITGDGFDLKRERRLRFPGSSSRVGQPARLGAAR